MWFGMPIRGRELFSDLPCIDLEENLLKRCMEKCLRNEPRRLTPCSESMPTMESVDM
jgi:hypothetical protein